ncbi:MAG: CoB--CoM heterodisulfide reductase iron-sulfur subunit A family protein [Thermodesulfovibrionales bacterium]|nr:CoB--CoM heterodisulfide reductase iron-sulfur subunit A family protein [Thermodesulfovibrionales bacterium]
MRIGVYLCNCGGNIKDKIDAEKVRAGVLGLPGVGYFKAVDFLCSEGGKDFLAGDLKTERPDRVVIAACTPREHENTFMKILASSGINPYLMQMVNVREQIAWVTEDKAMATEKAARLISAALRRVSLHEPLSKREIDVCPDVLVIGAGPAGLKAALSMAESGRRVSIVEKSPVIGGMPVRYEELFPSMECGPCMLEPVLSEVLHGEHSENIELLTLSEAVGVIGSYGNFTVKIKKRPRYIDAEKCIGCAECIGVCPASAENEFNYGMNERKAIYVPFAGALPNIPSIDETVCLRLKGKECSLCLDACPVEGAIRFDEKEQTIERNAGAVIVATGSGLYDCKKIPNLGYGRLSDVYTGAEFERMLSSNGPTEGNIKTSKGKSPKSVAIMHCVGSLDKNHIEYCSGICCQYAFKFNHLLGKKLPGVRIFHFYKELAVPGKEEFELYAHAKGDPNTTFIRYADITDLKVGSKGGKKAILFKKSAKKSDSVSVDMVVLCPAVVPLPDSAKLGGILGSPADRFGFFEELHGRLDASQSKIKGIYLAGACQSPMDIQSAMTQGMAVSGYVLSGLVHGRKLEISPVCAVVDPEKCSGCRVCVSVCPYKAISYDPEKETAAVNDVLCQGCGTCVAACPSGAIKGNHFTTEEIMAEIEGILR